MGQRIDLTGQRFGNLTAISFESIKVGEQYRTMWHCVCDCGNDTAVPVDRLRNGKAVDCGRLCKLRKPKPHNDLTGQRFGKLVVVEYIGNSSWRCQCDCGNEHIVKTSYLTTGDTKSCGKCSRAIDMTGKRFGKLTVVRRAKDRQTKRGDGIVMWECLCDCGNTIVTTRQELIKGHKNDCGCSRDYHDIVGKRFGRLVVKRIIPGKVFSSNIHAECQCDCGKITHPTAVSLIKGEIKSCGCLALEKMTESKIKHDMSGSRLYNRWKTMNQRCSNPNNSSYPNYGGRGITVCDEWKGGHGFENFARWAYENGYDETKDRNEQSIDRIDVNGNYCPENCRWADVETQMYNRTDTTVVNIYGEMLNAKQISEKYGIPIKTIRNRIYQGNITEDKLLYKGNLRELK